MVRPYDDVLMNQYLRRKKDYKHIHNYHFTMDGEHSICQTNVMPCCRTLSRFQVTCLNCIRKLGPRVERGTSLLMYGTQVRR